MTDISENTGLDQETRLHEDDHHSVKLWLRLLTCSSYIESQLRTKLRENFETTLPRFDFMAQLERSPDGLTMGQLSQCMMVSGGNVSGIASQLVKEGMIDRNPVPNNRRTYIVKLTARGRKAFANMAQQHERWVIQLLGHLPPAEVEQLMQLLNRIKVGLQANSGD